MKNLVTTDYIADIEPNSFKFCDDVIDCAKLFIFSKKSLRFPYKSLVSP